MKESKNRNNYKNKNINFNINNSSNNNNINRIYKKKEEADNREEDEEELQEEENNDGKSERKRKLKEVEMRESVHQKRTILSAVKSKYDQVNDFDNFIQSQFILYILYFYSSAKSYYQYRFLSSFHSVHLFIRFSLAYLPYFLFYNISYSNRPFILRIFDSHYRYSSLFQN